MAESKKSYRWDAEKYAKYSGCQYEWALELIEKLQLKGHETVLDIGCGDGKVTAAIADCLGQGRIVGIDSSEQMIDLARRRHGHYANARLAFKHQDVRALDEIERYDIVFSNATLHWIRRHRPVLRRVRDAMKKGGRLLFQMGGRENAAALVAVIDSMIAASRWAPYFVDFAFPYGFHGPIEYSRWLTEAGLKAERVELIEKDMRHDGMDGFTGWISTTWLPYLERIPAELKQSFVKELTEAYIREHPPDTDGRIGVQMVRLEVEAIRQA